MTNELVATVARAKAEELARLLAPIAELVGAGVRDTAAFGGLRVELRVWPAHLSAPPGAAESERKPPTPCETDILEVVRAVYWEQGRGLSGAAVQARLETAGRVHGKSTVAKALARLSGRGELTNDRKRGGYLPPPDPVNGQQLEGQPT